MLPVIFPFSIHWRHRNTYLTAFFIKCVLYIHISLCKFIYVYLSIYIYIDILDLDYLFVKVAPEPIYNFRIIM